MNTFEVILYVQKSGSNNKSLYFAKLLNDGVISRLIPLWDPGLSTIRRGAVNYRLVLTTQRTMMLAREIKLRDDRRCVGAADILKEIEMWLAHYNCETCDV